jgi:hypothetical protein
VCLLLSCPAACSVCGLCSFCCCRPLWSRVHELPPLDYQDPALLEPDPDLVLQEGPDALPFESMRPFLHKWEALLDVWRDGWRAVLQVWAGTCRATELLLASPAATLVTRQAPDNNMVHFSTKSTSLCACACFKQVYVHDCVAP